MYKDDLKDENGQLSKLNYLRRGLYLISWKLFRNLAHKTIPECTIFKVVLLYFDFLWCFCRYGAAATDYFEYRFWEKKHCIKKTYITKKHARYIQQCFNKLDGVKFVYNKLIFNKEYAEFRDTSHFEFPGTEESFLSFVKQSKRDIIAKPIYGFSGSGIYKPDVSTDEKAIAVYKEHCRNGEYLMEEYFFQSGILGEINPSSVNTVRIYTLHDGENVHIMNTCIRFGAAGSLVDNIHGGGMCCEVDRYTGIIIGEGVDLVGNRYVRHNASGIMVIGVQVPQWPRIISTVKKAALVHPEVGYVGWDIAVSEDKLTILEANEVGNIDLPQCCCRRGLKGEYDRILSVKLKNMKHNG